MILRMRFALSLIFAISLLFFFRRSSTAFISNGQPTVASISTSAHLPPSDFGTNLPHVTPSEYVQPDKPPHCTGSGHIRTPYLYLLNICSVFLSAASMLCLPLASSFITLYLIKSR